MIEGFSEGRERETGRWKLGTQFSRERLLSVGGSTIILSEYVTSTLVQSENNSDRLANECENGVRVERKRGIVGADCTGEVLSPPEDSQSLSIHTVMPLRDRIPSD